MKVFKNYSSFISFIKENNIYYRTKNNQDLISVSWTSGGVTGGNCWGGRPDQAINSEPEPSFIDLDKILELIIPNISYIQYKNLVNVCCNQDVEQHNDYYGNYTLESVKTVNLHTLFNYLKEKRFINSNV